MAESLHVDLTASAGGFISAVEQSTSALKSLQKQADSMGAIGNFLKSTVLPAASAIASAFAASKALSIFSESDLPGAKAYKEAIENSKKSITRLAAAVGEYLAPAAIRMSNIVTSIADRLTPLVRKFTAFSESATAFLLKLGSNFVTAFRQLVPALDDLAKWIEGLFNGPAREWENDIDAFRQWWNQTWSDILDYTAPLITSATEMIVTAFHTLQEVGTVAFEAVADFIEPFLAGAGEAGGAIDGLAAKIQGGLMTAMGFVTFALKNWRESWQIASEAILFYVGAIGKNLTVLWSNAVEGMKFFGNETKNLFASIFGGDGYVVKLAEELFTKYLPKLLERTMLSVRSRMQFVMSGGLMGNANAPVFAPNFHNPKIDFKPGDLPAFQALPGLGNFDAGDAGKSFRDALTPFLEKFSARGVIEGWRFMDAIRNGLPGVNAVVKPENLPASEKKAGLFLEGSREAYKAILDAQETKRGKTVVDIAKEQLKETKRQTEQQKEMQKALERAPRLVKGRL